MKAGKGVQNMHLFWFEMLGWVAFLAAMVFLPSRRGEAKACSPAATTKVQFNEVYA